ncbi:MAG: helix-hairpin-helix domain-containing protein [Clostridium sp.]|nr:helix-hairpin-helix domain-containing protein [Clostridium sp.]
MANNILLKIFNYSGLIFVLFPYTGCLTFMFMGWRVNETKWVDEGLIYSIPFLLLSFQIFNDIVVDLAVVFWIVAIVRLIFIFRSYSKKLNEKLEINESINHSINKDDLNKNQGSNFISFKTINEDSKYNEVNLNIISINTVSIDQLKNVPGLSYQNVEKIMELRRQGILITSMDDLCNKLNLTDVQKEQMEGKIVFTTDNSSNNRLLDI